MSLTSFNFIESFGLLELPVFVPPEFLAGLWNIDPETPMATYGRGSFDEEADGNGLGGCRLQVDVASWHIGRAVVSQGEQVDLIGLNGWGRHGAGREEHLAEATLAERGEVL